MEQPCGDMLLGYFWTWAYSHYVTHVYRWTTSQRGRNSEEVVASCTSLSEQATDDAIFVSSDGTLTYQSIETDHTRYALLTGIPFYACILVLPQQLQIVEGDSPTGSVVHLLPFLLAVPVSIAPMAFITVRFKIPYAIPMALASTITSVGIGVLSSFLHNRAHSYGLEVMLGVGLGPTSGIATIFALDLARHSAADDSCKYRRHFPS
jgi:hypothetical protein